MCSLEIRNYFQLQFHLYRVKLFMNTTKLITNRPITFFISRNAKMWNLYMQTGLK